MLLAFELEAMADEEEGVITHRCKVKINNAYYNAPRPL
jgi:hypothetical protein